MPAVAAIVAAEAVTTAMVVAAITQIGIGLSVVGAVTGNKTLMKIGGVMGLAGGVASLAGVGATAAGEAAATGLGANVAGDTAASLASEGVAAAGEQAAGGVIGGAQQGGLASLPVGAPAAKRSLRRSRPRRAAPVRQVVRPAGYRPS
jgi:hypothetical protein